MTIKKERINFSISKDIIEWIEKNTSKGGRSSFVEGSLRDRIKKVMNPNDAIKQEINYHDKEIKKHMELKGDWEKQLAIKNGKLKLIDATALEEINKKAELLDSMQSYQTDEMKKSASISAAILDHAPLVEGSRKDGTVTGQNLDKELMKKRAHEIIEKNA